MKLFPLALVILFTLTFIPPISAQEIKELPLHRFDHDKKNYREGEIIIKYKDTKSKEKALQAINTSPFQKKNQNVKIEDDIKELDILAIKSEEKTTEELIKMYENDDSIEYIEPNYIKTFSFNPNDTYFFNQWAHHRTDDHDIDTTEAWDIEQNTATETVVAVIDSGIDYDFPDLADNMWNGSGSCLSDTGISISCPNHGWDYVDNDNNPDDTIHFDENGEADDFQWHGTHVASIFGATTNNSSPDSMAGISRYNTIKMMALRFDLDILSEIKAINFAKNNGAKVINASFTGTGYSQAEKDAIDAFPGIIVTAAGNGGSDEIGDNNDVTSQYPCNYASNNIICVSASNQSDELSSFSNYGESVDIAAPGMGIFGIQQNNYYYGSGTSFAVPFVSGTTALLYAHRPTASNSTIKNFILKSSDHLENLSGKISCSRRLNVNQSLQSLINNSLPNEMCTRPVYRFYSPTNKSHFFTISESEKDRIITQYSTDWRYEDIAYYVPSTSADNQPVYRFYSPTNKSHFFTISESEKDRIITQYSTDWRYEGISYYVPN